MLFLINYDLCSPGQNYTDLVNAIQSYGSWARISGSCWVIQTNKTAVEIRNHLMEFIDQNDSLFVCDFNKWASWNITPEALNLLKN